MLTLLLALALTRDSVRIRPMTASALAGRADTASWGPPSIVLDGGGQIWLRRDSTTVYLAAWLPDSTAAWGDKVILSLDTNGDRARAPQHDDFQWEFHRVLDSSIVFRGRDGRWQAPHDDPDWRLGAARDGGGWSVQVTAETGGWSLQLRFDPEFFTQGGSKAPGLALAVYDEANRHWTTWPVTPPGRQPASLSDHPALWGTVVP